MNKKSLMYLIFISLLLVGSASLVSAKDLVWIDAPDSIESQYPVKVSVKIEDPDVLKYTNKLYYYISGGSVQYLQEGQKDLQMFISEYNGEKELNFIVWGTYNDYYLDNTINFTIIFASDYTTLSKDFDPEELGYVYNVGTVSKLIEVLPVKAVGSRPDYPGCEVDEYTQLLGASSYTCYYKGDEERPRVRSAGSNVVRHACIPGTYQLDNNLVGCSYMQKSKLGTTEQQGNAVIEINSYNWGIPFVGEGTNEGYIRHLKDFSENRRYTDKEGNVKYNVIYMVDFYQKSGWISYTGSVKKEMWLEKDDIESEYRKIIGETEKYVGSISFQKQGGLDSGKNYNSQYKNFLPGKLQDTSLYLYGYVTDINKNPLPYMQIIVLVKDKEYRGNTSFNGDYEIELTDLKLKEDEEVNATVFFYFDYHRDDKNYYNLYFYKQATDTYVLGSFGKYVLITPESHGELNIVLDGRYDLTMFSNMPSYEDIRDHGVIYVRMHEALEFALTRLHQTLDYKLPIEVLVGQDDKKTLYSPGTSMIKIAKSDQSYLSSNNPKNREYHEFAHALMYDIYGEWPKDRSMPDTKNHDGFLNPSTADSYMEGFAEFMAMAIAKYHGDKEAHIYASFGSMEDNYKPWHGRGFHEEFAVASLLWDMYDDTNEPGDSLTMSLDDIWRVLAVNRPNFYEYYKAFKARFPEKEKEFDELFKLHGFFYDTREGNKKWDPYEPIRDLNKNNQHDAGEFFVDLSPSLENITYNNKFRLNITYEEGFKIGKATNYERKDRTQAVRLHDAFLKVDQNGPRFYKITVKYNDRNRETYSYTIEQKQGLLYVHPRPDDTDAVITIEPETEDFTFKKKFEISNFELIEKVYSSSGKGSFAEHDFVLTNLGTKNDPVYAEEGFEPSYTTDEGMDEKITYKIEGKKISFSGKKLNFFGILFRILIVGGLGFFGYKYFTDEKTKTTTHNIAKKIGKGVKKAHHEVKTKHVPKMKYHAKKAHETFKEKHLPVIKRTLRKLRAIAIETWKEISKRVKKAYDDFKEKNAKKRK